MTEGFKDLADTVEAVREMREAQAGGVLATAEEQEELEAALEVEMEQALQTPMQGEQLPDGRLSRQQQQQVRMLRLSWRRILVSRWGLWSAPQSPQHPRSPRRVGMEDLLHRQ